MRYLVKRAITYVVILFAVLNIAFIAPRLIPGNVAALLAPNSHFLQQEEHLIAIRLGLDQPVYIQYLDYMKNVFSWPPYFGASFQFNTPVTDLFMAKLPWTLLLIVTAFFLSIGMSVGAAAIGSLRRGGKAEMTSLYSSIVLHAVPTYWIAMLFLWVFALTLGWFPAVGAVGINPGSGLNYAWDVTYHAILPIIVLALSMFGSNYILLRGTTQEVLQSDYIMSAKARGLKKWTIAMSYILRNSLLPFVSLSTFSVATLISRVVLIEAVFGYPGIGDLIVDGAEARDYPVLVGSFFFVGIMVVIGGIIGDIILTRLDPRLRGTK